jgi:hypothetical protein
MPSRAAGGYRRRDRTPRVTEGPSETAMTCPRTREEAPAGPEGGTRQWYHLTLEG